MGRKNKRAASSFRVTLFGPRHYGLVAKRGRSERLAVCRALLAVWAVAQVVVEVLGSGKEAEASRRRCPVCGSELCLVVAELPPEGEARLRGRGQCWQRRTRRSVGQERSRTAVEEGGKRGRSGVPARALFQGG